MIGRPADWLLGTFAVPLAGAIGAFIAFSFRQRRWGMGCARIGIAGGVIGAAVIAALLGRTDGAIESIRVPLGHWISFSQPESPVIAFGLEATLVKVGLVGLTGGLAFVALWWGQSQSERPISQDAVLATSLLYAAGVFFALAPNLVQSLMGWAAISFFSGILIRLSNVNHAETRRDNGSSHSPSRSESVLGTTPDLPRQRALQSVVEGIERISEMLLRELTSTFPNWLAEQIEAVDEGPVSIQLLASILGSSAVLLTWLLL